jgi:hypothetical protein
MELREILNSGVDIFNFEYPIFNESYRPIFEKKFIDKFYFDEIGVETVGRFIHNLRQQLNLIMPYYNKIYISQSLEQRILDNYDITETFDKTSTNITVGEGETTNVKNTTSSGNSKNLYSDTPKKKIDIDTNDYVSNISKDTISNTLLDNENLNNTSTVNDDGVEKWVRTMKGNIGIQTDANAVMVYEQSLRNIDEEIFTKLEILFMGVW